MYPHFGNNQQLSNWASDQLNKREIMPGTEKLASYPGLMKLWILEKESLPSILPTKQAWYLTTF